MDGSPDKKQLYKIPEVPGHLSDWIHSLYVVTFDIEFGQAVEEQFPKLKELELTDQEINNICYSSFPDSNSSILGSTQFHFRIRLSKLNEKFNQFYAHYNTQTTQALGADPQFIFGYVHFLQRKDTSLKRGFFQKSLVILSLLPYVELFYHVVNVLGTSYFNTEDETLLKLDDIYDQIRKWPPLRTGIPLSLSMLGSSTIALYIPNKDDKLNSLHSNLSPTSTSFANRMRMLRNKHHHHHTKVGGCSSGSNNNDIQQREVDGDYVLYEEHQQQQKQTGYLASTVHGTPLTLVSPHHNYQTILTAFDMDLYRCFYSVISDLQLLWEMILTCEPFIVFAQTPDVCANFVQALTSLIYPFKYNADYRPFFTIHDPEFKEYVGLRDTRPSVILGVTNPFFAKSLEHWPNVIQLCSMTSSKSSDQLSSLITSFSSMNSNAMSEQQSRLYTNQVASPPLGVASNSQQQALKIPFVDRLRFSSTEVHKPGLNTKFKGYLLKDRHFLTKILRSNKAHGNNRPNSVQTALIRRWLIELTQSFFMPLERYLTQLMPLHSRISPFKAPPELPSFHIEAFLETLDTSGPQLTTKIKGDWLGLYKRFFASANFNSWYTERKGEIDRKLWHLHLDSFLDLDLPQVIKTKDEVELVDMVIYFKRRLATTISRSQDYQFTCEHLDQFNQKLVELINSLPEDMRTFFLQRQ